MAGRPPVPRIANVPELSKLAKSNDFIVIDLNPVIAYVMNYCGSGLDEIGEVLGITKQGAQYLVETAKKRLNNGKLANSKSN